MIDGDVGGLSREEMGCVICEDVEGGREPVWCGCHGMLVED